MSLTLHLMRADARRFAMLIGLWIAITIAGTIVVAMWPPITAQQDGLRTVLLATGWIAATGLGVMLVALVVQQHPALGTNAWWMTRPVTPKVLLGSRLVLLGAILVGVPAVCDLTLMARHGVSAGRMTSVVVEWTMVGIASLGLVMMMALLTTSLARFTVLMIAWLVGVSVTLTTATWIALTASPPFEVYGTSSFAGVLISRPEDPTGLVASWVILISTAAVGLYTLYARRTRGRAVTIGIAGGVLAMAAAVAWPWPLLQASARTPVWAGSAEALRVHGPSQSLYFDNAGFQEGSRPRWRTAHARVYISELPEGWIGVARLGKGTLDFEGGSITSGPFKLVTALTPAQPDTTASDRALQYVLGVRDISGANASGGSTLPIVAALASEVPSGQVQGSYRGELEIDLVQFEEAAVLPLRIGGSFEDGAHRVVIDDVRSLDRGPVLRLRTALATSALDRRSPSTYTYFLRNRSAGEALAGTWRPSSYLPHPGKFVLGRYGLLGSPFGFKLSSGNLSFPSTASARLGSALTPDGSYQWTDERWLEGAELVIIRTVDHGTVTRRLELQGLTVNPR